MNTTAEDVSNAVANDSPNNESPTDPEAVKKYTSEMLRMTLPLIAENGSSYTPVSYAVWYEYVRGENTELRGELDALIDNASTIDEPQTLDVYQRHVLGKMEQAIHNGQNELLNVLNLIDDSVEGARSSTTLFDSRLSEFSQVLQGPISAEEMSESVSSFQGDLKNVSGAIGSLHEKLESSREEVRQLAKELSQAREEARVDPLSGLLNRRGLNAAVQDAIDQFNEKPAGTNKPLTFVMFDIDHFKAVNDEYGHLVGDKVIQSVARTLSHDVMRKDFVGRLGGEEFGLLLPDTGAIGAMAVAERIRQTIEETKILLKKSKVDLSVTISGGIAIYRGNESAEDFLDRADRALYQAKEAGRNKIGHEA